MHDDDFNDDWDAQEDKDADNVNFSFWNWHTILTMTLSVAWMVALFVLALAWTCASAWSGCQGGWQDVSYTFPGRDTKATREAAGSASSYNLDFSLWDPDESEPSFSEKYGPQTQGPDYYSEGFNLKLISDWESSIYNNEKVGESVGGIVERDPNFLVDRCSNRCEGYWVTKTVTVEKPCSIDPDTGDIEYCEGTAEIRVPMSSTWEGNDYLATAVILTVIVAQHWLSYFTDFFTNLEVEPSKFDVGAQGEVARQYFGTFLLYICSLNWFAWNDSDRGTPRDEVSGVTYNSVEYATGQFINRWTGMRWANIAFFGALFFYHVRLIACYRESMGIRIGSGFIYAFLSLTVVILNVAAVYT